MLRTFVTLRFDTNSNKCYFKGNKGLPFLTPHGILFYSREREREKEKYDYEYTCFPLNLLLFKYIILIIKIMIKII